MKNNMNEKTNIVTRFAPSPTGFMHIGGIRTALFAYLYARKNNGTFLLRIEDTDKEREVPGSIEHIQKSLSWLGISWDFGPDSKETPYGSMIQSERLSIYKKYALELIEKGLAYPDPYTKEEVEEFRKQADEKKEPFLFRNHRPETFEVWDETKPLRLKVPEIKRYTWHDEVRGDLEAGEEALDDLVIIKADGYPTYNFAHIIDDHEMGVTHVMRGDEFVSSTPRFLSIHDALGFKYPIFVSLPPILRDDRTKKLGKRDGAKDILDYEKEGYIPQAMVNYLALIGWNPGTEQELFSMEELIQSFDITKIQKSGGAFDDDKLNWFNKEYIKKMSDEECKAYMLPYMPKEYGVHIDILMPIIKERIHTFEEVRTLIEEGEFTYFIEEPMYQKESLYFPNSKLEDTQKEEVTKKVLTELVRSISSLETTDRDTVKNALWDYATEIGRGDVLWPLRYALSGKEKSPDPFVLVEVLGKEKALQRISFAESLFV